MDLGFTRRNKGKCGANSLAAQSGLFPVVHKSNHGRIKRERL
jgi:hypothetical protein